MKTILENPTVQNYLIALFIIGLCSIQLIIGKFSFNGKHNPIMRKSTWMKFFC